MHTCMGSIWSVQFCDLTAVKLDDKASRINVRGLFNFSSLKWRVDSRLNTTYKLVIVWNMTLDYRGSLLLSLRLCSTLSILNSDGAKITFAVLSLTFRGHEAGLFHAYWVIISCGLERDVLLYSSSDGIYFCGWTGSASYKCLMWDCSKRFLISW